MTKEEAEAVGRGVSLDMEATQERWWDQVRSLGGGERVSLDNEATQERWWD